MLEAGTRLGPYDVVAPLGAGGMGEVYEARDVRLDRTVALKILPASLVADAERRQRFIQEARLASALQHAHIVTVFDIGSAPEGDYLAMELVRGQTLDKVIPTNGMRVADALTLAMQMADALAAAHAAGIVHRDLKPGNIMVSDHGDVKILDFGLATLTEPTVASGTDETRAHQALVDTRDGVVLGTVAYMSPEQAEGRKVDARSDIFSFGSILYEMLSGQRAFQGDSVPGILAAVIAREPAPLSTVAPTVTGDLERLVGRCLRKDVTKRAQHASDLEVALEEMYDAVSSGPVAPPAPQRRWAQGAELAVAAGVAAVLVVVAALLLWWPRSAPAPTAFTPQPLTSLPGTETNPSFSPDASQVAFVWARDGVSTADVYATVIGGSAQPLRLTDDGVNHSWPAWSPDGRTIATWHHAGPTGTTQQATLVLTSPLGGPERTLLEWEGSTRQIVWSPDGRWLAFSPVVARLNLERGITLVSPATGQRVEWAAIDPAFQASASPAFSPDGRRMAFVKPRDDFASDLFVVDVGADGTPAGAPRHLLLTSRDVTSPVWTADGRELLVIVGAISSNGGVARVPADGSRRETKIAGLERAALRIVLSPDGRRLAFARDSGDTDIWRIDATDPAATGRIAPSTLWDEGADVSPDGRRVVFSSNRSGAREIWVADVSGDNAVALTAFGGPVPGTARWSPDGNVIAFDGRPGATSEVFVVSPAGGAVRQVTDGPGEDARPAWSHDGRWIYFSSDRSGQSEIWRVAPDGGNPAQVTRNGGNTVVASLDGEWLYYQPASGPSDIRRVRPDGSGDEIVVDENVRFLGFDVSDDALWWVLNPDGGRPEVMLRRLPFGARTPVDVSSVPFVPAPVGITVSRDGRFVHLTRPVMGGSDLLRIDDFR